MNLIKSKPKVFCIGFNKTGTTSLGTFLESEGFRVAKQREGELLLKPYIERDFTSIIKYCKKSKAQVFQDVPFSLPYTFMHLHNAFPESKFILTERNSDELWYKSILKFHSDMFNKGEKPTAQVLQEFRYVYKGWAWDLMNDVFFKSGVDLYNEEDFKAVYNAHNTSAKIYFKSYLENFIIVNLAETNDFKKLSKFLDLKTSATYFPKITSKDIVNKNYNSKFLK